MFTRSLLVAVLLLILIAPTALAHPTPHPATRAPNQATTSATPRWIVRLYDPPLTQAPNVDLEYAAQSLATSSGATPLHGRMPIQLDAPAVQQHRAFLHQQQAAVLQQIQQMFPAATVQRHYTILLNGMSVALPGSDATVMEQLRAVPGVAEVYAEQEYFPAMYGSIPLINADQLWNNPTIGGQANAGAGIKIAVLDQGIKIDNPFFNPEGFAYPPGYPLGETAHTTPKVIAARAYFRPGAPALPGHETPEPGPNDSSHGTHSAGIAAGVANTTATIAGVSRDISGVAPRAYLMNYKIFYQNDTIFQGAFTTEIIAALEDAVADGADIINNSWGGRPDTDPAFSPITLVAEAASDAGVVMVFAAGNEGPDRNTAASPAHSEKVISVGATSTAQTLAAGFVDVVAPAGAPDDLTSKPFGPANFGPPIGLEVIGPLSYTPIETISGDTLACEPLPPDSLTGKIALIERGICVFSVKVVHAQEAGASAVIVYNSEEGGETIIVMAAADRSDEVNIPSIFVQRSTGVGMREWYAAHGSEASAQIDPEARVIDQTPDVLIDFSSRGPTFHNRLKPDVVAPGFNILSAGFAPMVEGLDQHLGFGVASGTSMAAPHVAGAAALLKQVHPEWSPADIKSALMSTAVVETWLDDGRTQSATVLESGAGRIDLARAVNPGLIFDPPSLSFGTLATIADQPTRAQLTVNARNISDAAQTYALSASSVVTIPFAIDISPTEITLDAGQSADFTVAIEIPAGAVTGDYEAMVQLDGPQALHLPLWARTLPAQEAATVLLLDNDASSSLEFHNYADYYVNALEDLGISYAYLDLDARAGEVQTLPDLGTLQQYPLILWFTGDNLVADGLLPVPTPLTEKDQNLLIAYLQSGGNLIATGQDLTFASDIDRSPPDDPRYGRSDMYHGYLGARFVQDDVFTRTSEVDRTVVGTEMQPWLNDIALDLSNPLSDGRETGDDTSAGNQTSVDEVRFYDADPRWLDPYTTPLFRAVSGSSEMEGFVGMSRASSPTLEDPRTALPFRTLYLTFGLEGVRSDTGSTTMHDFLHMMVSWALDWSAVEVAGTTTTTEPDQTLTFTAATQSSTGASFVAYRWDFGDGSPIVETSEPTVSHQFATPGSYQVRVEATNYWGHRTVSAGTVEPAPPVEPQPPAGNQQPVETAGTTGATGSGQSLAMSDQIAAATAPLTFSETGQTLQGRFLDYWQTNGGLAVFGYPLTAQSDTAPVSQQFERARFEYHPDNAPPYDVLLSHLGVEALEAQGRDWRTFPTVQAAPEECLYFAETQHSLCGTFKEYWQHHGLEFDGQTGSSHAESLALFGLPISEPQQEVGEDGTLLTVQWFERARFEHHPDNEPPYDVLLGRLGAQPR